MKDAYIWRDKHDHNQYWIGVKNANGSYAAWFACFTDGFDDIFGDDIAKHIKALTPGDNPWRIHMSLKFAQQRQWRYEHET